MRISLNLARGIFLFWVVNVLQYAFMYSTYVIILTKGKSLFKGSQTLDQEAAHWYFQVSELESCYMAKKYEKPTMGEVYL